MMNDEFRNKMFDSMMSAQREVKAMQLTGKLIDVENQHADADSFDNDEERDQPGPLPSLTGAEIMERIRQQGAFKNEAMGALMRVAMSLDFRLEPKIHFIFIFSKSGKEYLSESLNEIGDTNRHNTSRVLQSFKDVEVERGIMYKTMNGLSTTEWTTMLFKDFLYISCLFESDANTLLRYEILSVI